MKINHPQATKKQTQFKPNFKQDLAALAQYTEKLLKMTDGSYYGKTST